MGFKIVEGGFYKAKNGQKLGPARLGGQHKDWPWDFPQNARSYYNDCGVPGGAYADSVDWSIVSEWSEGPVRTVTSREVVEWSDDVLTVVPHESGRVYISFNRPYDLRTKKQILSACMVMSQIAEAMDDGESK